MAMKDMFSMLQHEIHLSPDDRQLLERVVVALERIADSIAGVDSEPIEKEGI